MDNGSNGGETPDNNEDLWVRFEDTGLSLNDASRKLLDHSETNFNTPQNKMVDIPQAARRANQRVRIYQLTWSGTYQYDYYGFIQLTYGSTVVSGNGPGVQRKNLFGISGDAGVSFRPNWVGSGVLFNFSTALFTKTFNYVGEGSSSIG